MPISTMCGREGFLEDSSAARNWLWRVGQANASSTAVVSQVLRITLVMNRGPFAWYFLGPVDRPRTCFALPPPRTTGHGYAPQSGGAVRIYLVLYGGSIARGKRTSRHLLVSAVSRIGVFFRSSAGAAPWRVLWRGGEFTAAAIVRL